MSKNEALSAEVADSMPDGAPELRPLVALSRQDRAKVLRTMATVLPKLEALGGDAAPDEDDPAMPARNAGKAAWTEYARDLGLLVRSDATRRQIQEAVDEHRAAQRPPLTTAQRLEQQAVLVELAADLEPLVTTLAVDEDAARTWCESAHDVEVIAVVLAYQRGAQPGEAKRSSS
ncbi:hypothetical protein ACWEFJ_28445 [Actinosynnema sp. NPDC004786]